jgi:hypothetical protein
MTFNLDERDLQKITDWLDQHDLTCKFADPDTHGAIGGRLTYSFTPTGLGHVTIVHCACGVEHNFTDYESW